MLRSTTSPPGDRQQAAAAPFPGRRSGKWTRGLLFALRALVTALVLLCHGNVPNTPGNLGSLLETFLPWVGVTIPLVAVGALVRRSATAAVAVLVPVLVWAVLFGELMVPGKGG